MHSYNQAIGDTAAMKRNTGLAHPDINSNWGKLKAWDQKEMGR